MEYRGERGLGISRAKVIPAGTGRVRLCVMWSRWEEPEQRCASVRKAGCSGNIQEGGLESGWYLRLEKQIGTSQ